MISTSRTSENGTITIDLDKCNGCGICVTVCKDFSLVIENKKVKLSDTPLFGCIACSQCVTVCNKDAIMVTGRTISETDYQAIKPNDLNYESFHNLLLNRRSVRDYKNELVPKDLIERIIQTASTAPMGIPPSDVGVWVLEGKEKVRQFSFDFISVVEKMQFMVSPYVMPFMKPFMSRENYTAMKEFVRPLVQAFVSGKKENKNHVLYDAPVVMMFYGKMSDPADPYIAATYAMLAAEAQGLGSCMIGSVGPFLQHAGKAFKKKYGLPEKFNGSLFLTIGYPRYKYNKTVKRTFASVDYH